jgi:glycolate oxidase iron-sulfur subunit
MTLSLDELIVEADRCVACGLCLPHCPTYHKTGSEADSPRGRIQLMRAVAQDIIPNNNRFKEHIDLCLSCRSCESACPNSVNYGALVDASRATFIPKKSWLFNLAKPWIRHRQLQHIANGTLWLMQKAKLLALLSPLLPMIRRIPLLDKPIFWTPLYPAKGHANNQATVSLFLGCATNTLDNKTIASSIFVLNQLGVNVHIPQAQSCCGSMARQMGDASEAEHLTALNANSFDQKLPIISIASGCGAGLKDYLPHHQIMDIHEYLMTCDWSKAEIAPSQTHIFVHEPCTLRNVLKSSQYVTQLLKKIPEATIEALPNNSQCCGGAGAYVLTQKEMASNLLQDKLNLMKQNNVTILATANIGCSLHMQFGIQSQQLKIKVEHPINIIAKQMGFLGSI